MKQTVSNTGFHQAFSDYNRKDNFSSDGLDALFEYLEEMENGLGEEIELDVIGLCCDYSEYPNASEAVDAMGHLEDCEDDQTDDELLDILRDHYQVIEVPGGSVIISG